MREKCTLNKCAKALENVMFDKLLNYFQEHKDELLQGYKDSSDKQVKATEQHIINE